MEASVASPSASGTTRGSVGRETFEKAAALIKGGKKPTEAFALVAEETGRSAATVATAYYRIARTMPGGAGVKQRKRRGRPAGTTTTVRAAAATRSARGRRGASSNGSASALVRELVDAASALASHVERLERENAEYRQITAALDRLKR